MPILDARAPTLAPGVEVLGELDGAGQVETPGLVRRGDGQTLQVTRLLHQLLELVDGERDLDQLAVALAERTGRAVTADDVEFLLREKVAPLGILANEDGSAPVAEKPVPLLGLRWKVVVTDPELTRRLTAPFAALFRPWVVLPTLVLFGVVCWWVLWERGFAGATRQAFDRPGLLLGVFVLTIISAGWHELGHAAACRAKGATPGAMGAGLYLVWPAFYTDVDDSYRLSRWGRLVVDLGGLYFNALAAVAITATWMVVRVDALLLLVGSQLLLMLRQLAPIVRADGYHILADLTGVPDLFQHIRPTLAGMLPWRWGRPQPLRPWARWVVRAWVLVVVPLLLSMALTALLLFPRLVATAWVGIRQHGRALVTGGADGDLLGAAASSLRLVALVLPVLAVGYQIVRIGRRASTAAWAKTEGRPRARGALVAAAVGLAALLLLLWWPAGQYQPVHADERGAVPSLLQPQRVRAQASRPIAGVQPRTGYVLTPRSGRGPSLVVLREADGTTTGIVTSGDRTGTAFPFALPQAPGEGDNQALAVNTTDGSTVYDVSVALVWVTDGSEVADNRNEAYALASCTGCTTVAIAFQVVLIVGQTDAIAPVNVAVAANGGCLQCTTAALAVQLVLTLDSMPPGELRAQIEDAMAGLADLASSDDPVAEIEAVQQEITALLVDGGYVQLPSSGTTTQTTTQTTAVTSTTTAPSGASSTSSSVATTSTTRQTTSTTRQATTTSSTSPTSTTTTSSSTSDTTAATQTTTAP